MRRTAVALLAAAAFGGCGDQERSESNAAASPTPSAKPVGKVSQGSVVQYADCGDWHKGSPAEKRATVVELRSQLTPQGSASTDSPLADERAYEILEGACSPSYASSFRLYKLYARAQAFAPLDS